MLQKKENELVYSLMTLGYQNGEILVEKKLH